MSPFLIAILSVAVGLVACFVGYQLFRILLPLLGGLYGATLAYSWFGPGQELLALFVGLFVCAIFALLAYFLWSLTVGIGGVAMGFGAGVQLAAFLGLGGWFAVIIGVVLAVVFGLLFFGARDSLVMLASAVGGAGLVLSGLAVLMPGLLGWLANERNLITFFLTLVLAAAGFSAQYRSMAGRQTY
jgi:hypothetical protein